MRLGVFTVILSGKPFEEAVKYLKSKGVTAVELGCGGYPASPHADAEALLKDPQKIAAMKKILTDNGMIISAFSVHGNPVHPDKEAAGKFHKDFENAVLLAEKFGVDTVITFSGCPGDHDGAKYPNWVTCPWPEDFLAILDYQWKVLVGYWKKAAEFAKAHGVTKIALEMHPGFCVYNPETLMRLRNEVGGNIIGANFDPSHLFWQGIDPVRAIKNLGSAIHHFHAKDVRVDKYNAAANGVLDTKHYTDELNRSWIFRSVGYGQDAAYWKALVSNLRMVGYDYAISIEHEDSLMSQNEGLSKAVALLKDVLIKEQPGEMWWA